MPYLNVYIKDPRLIEILEREAILSSRSMSKIVVDALLEHFRMSPFGFAPEGDGSSEINSVDPREGRAR